MSEMWRRSERDRMLRIVSKLGTPWGCGQGMLGEWEAWIFLDNVSVRLTFESTGVYRRTVRGDSTATEKIEGGLDRWVRLLYIGVDELSAAS